MAAKKTVKEPIVEVNEEIVNESIKETVLKGNLINCVKLNIRLEPNTDSKIAFEADRDEIFDVELIKGNDEWIKVKNSKTKGKWLYAMAYYINVKEA